MVARFSALSAAGRSIVSVAAPPSLLICTFDWPISPRIADVFVLQARLDSSTKLSYDIEGPLVVCKRPMRGGRGFKLNGTMRSADNLETGRLEAWLADNIPGYQGPLHVEQFS